MPPLVIITGSDPVLIGDAVGAQVTALLGDADRSLALDEFAGDDYELSEAIDGVQTPPMLSDRRVVVARHGGRFGTKDAVAPLVTYLADPLPTSTLVLVWEKGPTQQRVAAVPKVLKEAASEVGAETIATNVPTGRGRDAWFSDQVRSAGVRLSRDAESELAAQLGDDVQRVGSVLALLEAVHGPGASLDVEDVRPYLGEAGSVPPWELTDAIERGDVAASIDRLHRMLEAGGRHPLQILASLQTHVGRWLALDGAGISDEREAARLLGMKGSTFPAKKALAQVGRMNSSSIARSVQLVARADVDVRGGSGWPPDMVMEVLVARLATLTRRR